jgi:hypothetical protein
MTDTYVSPTFELYECMVCKKRYKLQVGSSITDNPKIRIMSQIVNYGPLDGCCTAGSLREIKDESTQGQS